MMNIGFCCETRLWEIIYQVQSVDKHGQFGNHCRTEVINSIASHKGLISKTATVIIATLMVVLYTFSVAQWTRLQLNDYHFLQTN